MKVLVTGAAGFIGSYVVEDLEGRGIEVIRFDHHVDAARGDHFLGDVIDFVAVNEAVAISDGVIHLAGVLGTAETINEPRPAVETNIMGSLNVFQACRNYDKRCVYISVGNYWMHNSYSITKTVAENFAYMFNKEHGTEIAVVRALNAYGPRQKSAPVRKIMPNFILPALKDEELIVYGDGQQIMDMIFVKDVAEILVKALLVDHGQYVFSPQRNQDATVKFEAGTGRPTTVLEIAELVVKTVGKGQIKHVPMRGGEPEGSIVLGDPMTLRSLYGGEVPSLTALEDGIVDTIEYYRGD